MSLQIPGLSFQSADLARRIAIEGDPARPPILPALSDATRRNGAQDTAVPEQHLLAPSVDDAQSPGLSSREDGELSDVSADGISSEIEMITPGQAVAVPRNDGADTRPAQNLTPNGGILSSQQQALHVINVLLKHGYPRTQLVQDIAGLHKAVNLVPPSVAPPGPPPAITPSHIAPPSPRMTNSTEITVATLPPAADRNASANSTTSTPEPDPANLDSSLVLVRQAVAKQQQSRDPDDYKKKLEALRKGKAAAQRPPAPDISMDDVASGITQPVLVSKKKATLDTVRLRERLAALKAQNAKPEGTVDATTDGRPFELGNGRQTPRPISSSSSAARNPLMKRRPTASDLISADTIDLPYDIATQNDLAFDRSYRSTPGEQSDERMVIEVSSSESDDDDDHYTGAESRVRQNGTLTRAPVSQDASQYPYAQANNGVVKPKTEAELRAEIELLNASIAARLVKRAQSKADTPTAGLADSTAEDEDEDAHLIPADRELASDSAEDDRVPRAAQVQRDDGSESAADHHSDLDAPMDLDGEDLDSSLQDSADEDAAVAQIADRDEAMDVSSDDDEDDNSSNDSGAMELDDDSEDDSDESSALGPDTAANDHAVAREQHYAVGGAIQEQESEGDVGSHTEHSDDEYDPEEAEIGNSTDMLPGHSQPAAPLPTTTPSMITPITVDDGSGPLVHDEVKDGRLSRANPEVCCTRLARRSRLLTDTILG